MKGSSGYIREFEGVRGVLAIWVFLFHVLTITGTWENLPRGFRRIFDGSVAVGIFICLSGFVISKLILESPAPYSKYLARRAARIYPVYLLCVAISIMLIFLGIMPKRFEDYNLFSHLVSHALLIFGAIPKWISGNGSVFLNPAWSVSLEWQFYLIAPFFVRLASAGTVGLMLAGSIPFIFIRVFAQKLQGFGDSTLLLSIDNFYFGMVVYMVARNVELKDYLALFFAALACISAITLSVDKHLYLILWFFLATAVFGNSEPICRFLASEAVIWLGMISFPMYLVHEPIIWTVKFLIPFDSLGLGLGALLVGLASLILMLAFSHLISKYLERPAISWGRRQFG